MDIYQSNVKEYDLDSHGLLIAMKYVLEQEFSASLLNNYYLMWYEFKGIEYSSNYGSIIVSGKSRTVVGIFHKLPKMCPSGRGW